MKRIVVGFIGICSLIIGVGTLRHPITYHHIYGVSINYENIKWPLFLVVTIFGVSCLYISLSKRFWNSCYWICPNCEEVFNLMNNKEIHYCSKCGHILVKLEGFYD